MEFEAGYQWIPPVTLTLVSGALIALIRSRRASPATVVRIGLVYQVVFSYAIASGAYLGAFEGMTAEYLTVDRVGLSYVVPWMLVFTVLVPARPREAILALLASATAVPVVYLAQVPGGAAPSLAPDQFFSIFIAPYALTAVFSYVAARVVHSLGVEVRRAHELGSYRLESLLGRGGMGEVWRASHQSLARPAAIKVIRRDTRVGPETTAADLAAARFEQEAQVIASLQSPHTVELYDFGTAEDGTLFYVMELLEGIDLDALVRRHGPLPPERVVHLMRQVCASLAEAHRRGAVHRDIKPANIYLCRLGVEHDFVKVLDFGLVKQVTPVVHSAAAPVTLPDLVAGTPHFMAPELALGSKTIDGRVDLYSLGCVAYWLLTGRLVFDAETPTATIVAHVQTPPSPPSGASEMAIPEALDRIVLDCLAKDPDARPQSAEALAARLASIQFERPWTQADAARWWERHRPRLETPSS
jgi:serine/threonine-protein kinase